MESLSLGLISVRRFVLIVDSDLIRLRPDDFYETPIADPHDGCCGEGRLNAVPYPIYAAVSSNFSLVSEGRRTGEK